MKKPQMIIIDVHSFVDVITNSSTEIFVCNTGKTLDQVESILREKLDAFNKWKDTVHEFEHTFQRPYVYTQEMLDEAGKWRHDFECKENVGKIMIRGCGDNSIPYEMWDQINDLFGSHNEHLG